MHLNVQDCQSCEEKLRGVHPDLVAWVRLFRSHNPDAHVSCGHRGKADQEDAFSRGASKAHYGESAHNGVPSMAVDFFRLTQAGQASFDKPWFEGTLAPAVKAAGFIWGGDWKSIKDAPHVEMPGFIKF